MRDPRYILLHVIGRGFVIFEVGRLPFIPPIGAHAVLARSNQRKRANGVNPWRWVLYNYRRKLRPAYVNRRKTASAAWQ